MKKRMKIAIFNLGCKVNQYECDVLTEKLTFYGHEVAQELVFADVYILNTCAVTAEAERKSRQAISRCLKLNPNAKVIVMGCASQKSPESFRKDGVIYVKGVAEKMNIIDHLQDETFMESISDFPVHYEEMTLKIPHRTRAFVKIQDGCNHFCSYCIIPYLRGRSRSRDLRSIVDEINILSGQTKEVVLTGIDIMHYGKDNGESLTNLIRAIADADVRIRLSSVYAEEVSPELLDALFSLKHFCSHFHLSLQSGDDGVLKDMNRRYTTAVYRDKINLIRKYDQNAGITTDVIVGYPTETDEAFENTLRFVQEEAFTDLHVFPFSSRSGTVAARLPQISPDLMKTRKKRMAQMKETLKKNFLEKNLFVPQNVLIEEKIGDYNVGYSENYIKIYTKKDGELLTITPTALFNDGLKEV